jgi:glyoxylate/hydroxypyruvate reductase A
MALLIIGSLRASQFASAAREHGKGLDIRVWPDAGRIEDIRYALAWQAPHGVLKTLPNLQLIVSVGAGVDHLLSDPALPDVPLSRYVDPDLSNRMAQYVACHVLFHQRRMSEYIALQRKCQWTYLPEPAAHEVRVGLMGLGEMGQAAIRVLRPLSYQLRGWSRTPRAIDGVECFAGSAGLDSFLAETDILVALLPYTPATHGIINRDLLRKLSRRGRHERMPGGVLINAGRGGLQVEADIVAAIEAGELYAASLDVFETEPLPAASPLWSSPRVVITPHNAAESNPRSIARYCLRQISRQRSGEPVENLVDRERGY